MVTKGTDKYFSLMHQLDNQKNEVKEKVNEEEIFWRVIDNAYE
jgi:hypothetical protein